METELDGIARNSIRFQNSGNCFHFQNYKEFGEFHLIPELRGIRSSSVWTQFRELREFDGTRSVTSRSVILNDDRVRGIGRNWFRGGTDSAMFNIAE